MTKLFPLLLALVAIVSFLQIDAAQGQTREEKVRQDKQKIEAEGFWIYNDLKGAFAKSRQTGQPILVVLRCVPCEECVKLDDEVVDRDPEVRPLLEKFVCVRQVSTNGLDLSLFQFDTDQSWAVFLLNADGAIYGRFGTRSHRTEWSDDVSLKGLAEAMRGALELHAAYPGNQQSLAGKRGQPPVVPSPERFPKLSEKYTDALNYSGNVVQSCIHCHQIGDALREWHRDRQEPIPEEILFPFPHPKSIGLILDPDHRALVAAVESDSLAERAGLRAGDALQSLAGQPILSIADVQWVLNSVPGNGGSVRMEVQREGRTQQVTLQLPDGWRRAGDIAWRASSWGLRRMLTGGMVLEELPAEQRTARRIPAGRMALRVHHVGQYGAHAAAKKAGFQSNDVLVEFGGASDLLTEAALFRHANAHFKVGTQVPVVVLRGDRRVTLSLPMQP